MLRNFSIVCNFSSVPKASRALGWSRCPLNWSPYLDPRWDSGLGRTYQAKQGLQPGPRGPKVNLLFDTMKNHTASYIQLNATEN